MATGLLSAIGLFIATNIDDIIVLSLFFARGAGQKGTTLRILAGQYLGFMGILAAAVLVTLGAGAFLPAEAIPYFGLIPLALGLWAAWQAWRSDDDDDDESEELDDEEEVDSPPRTERRSKQHHDPAGGRGKNVAPSSQTQKRTRTSTPEPTEKVAKHPKVAPPKARKTLPRIKMDVPVASG